MDKFHGGFSDLEALLTDLGYQGQWVDDNDKKVFRSEDRAILNWWPSTGTLQTQGPAVARNMLEVAVTRALQEDSPVSDISSSTGTAVPVHTLSRPAISEDSSTGSSEKVFVVYGHDEDASEQLELVLRRLGLNPFVLGNTGGGGLTIIEALEAEILSPAPGKRFGIVLLTPDDMGYKHGDGPDNAEPRARQNVVMEMGMLLAAFGRKRVAILKKGHVEVPSDAAGIIYLSFNSHVREAAAKLCQRLVEAGFVLSSDSIAKVST